MKIKQLHAHFLISVGNYSNERVGFSVELEENDKPEEVVATLRQKAIEIVGKPANDLYSEIYQADQQLREVKQKVEKYRKEWDATAEFLKAQGIRPDAPAMPQFSNLLKPVEAETVLQGEFEDDIPL